MAIGPKLKWIKQDYKKIKIQQFGLFILSFLIAYLIIQKTSAEYLFTSILIAAALYLFFITIGEFFKKNYNFSQNISHFGFSLFILSVLFNSLFSSEFSANMKIGEELKYKNGLIKFNKIETFNEKNYKSIIANFDIVDHKDTITLNPEIRIYNQPNILTSEADIKSSFFSDKFLVINLLKGDNLFNVRYQNKPFMIWIWISILLLIFGGLAGFVKKYK